MTKAEGKIVIFSNGLRIICDIRYIVLFECKTQHRPSSTDLQRIQLADNSEQLSSAHLQSFQLMQCQGAQTLLQTKQGGQVGD